MHKILQFTLLALLGLALNGCGTVSLGTAWQRAQ
jgi:hypothetical protein